MNYDACSVKETFSAVCGHVTTAIEHHSNCRRSQEDFYSVGTGQNLRLRFHYHQGSTRWLPAMIKESKCIYCDAVEKGHSFQAPPNTGISDIQEGEGYKNISVPEQQSRRKFWEAFIADQSLLIQRQSKFLKARQDARQELEEVIGNELDNPNQEVGEWHEKVCGFIEDEQKIDALSWNSTGAEVMEAFHDFAQNFYFRQCRSMKESEICHLFDPIHLTLLTFGLLSPVQPEEIPSGEICGICTDGMDSIANESETIRRVFCGHHLFHQKCIVEWFENNRSKVTCPMCRDTRNVYRSPMEGWYPREVNAEDDNLVPQDSYPRHIHIRTLSGTMTFTNHRMTNSQNRERRGSV
ncbi:hypothetical protein NHQ30_005806 [Ciborinia camelliae]|nr:hypothetical protein NHQ30_005806 [Ciborinia camelliae]